MLFRMKEIMKFCPVRLLLARPRVTPHAHAYLNSVLLLLPQPVWTARVRPPRQVALARASLSSPRPVVELEEGWNFMKARAAYRRASIPAC